MKVLGEYIQYYVKGFPDYKIKWKLEKDDYGSNYLRITGHVLIPHPTNPNYRIPDPQFPPLGWLIKLTRLHEENV